jgi:hypothetical protein
MINSVKYGLSFRNCLLVLFSTMVFLPMPLPCAEIKLVPQLSIVDQYNDNIFYDSDSDDKVHDLAATISPALSLTDRTERLNASIQSRLQRIEYHEQKDLDSTDQYHSGRIGYRFTQNMGASAEAGYTRDSQIDRDIETTGLVFGTALRRRQHYSCATDSALSEKTSVNTTYSYDKDTFDNPNYTDSTIQSIFLSLAHNLDALVPQTTARITPGYSLYDYPHTKVTNSSLTIGASKRITEVVDISADVGSQLSRTRNELFHFLEQRTKTRGVIGQAVLSYRGELTNSSISYYKDVRSISGEVGIARYSSVRFNLSRRFSYEFTGDFTAEYYMYKQEKQQVSGTPIDETTIRIQPRLIYTLTNDLKLETSYRCAHFKYYESNQRVRQNLYSLSLIWQYPIPH